MTDDGARITALRLALSSVSTPATNQVLAELGADRGRLIPVLLEMSGLLKEAIEEHHPGGVIAWIQGRLTAELDAQDPCA